MPLRSKTKKVTHAAGKPATGRVRGRNGEPRAATELVIITGMSGSGKASALKAFEDLGYYCVDNLPVELIPRFAELALQSERFRARRWWWMCARGRNWRSCRRF